MIRQRAEEAEEQGEDVDAFDNPNEGLTGDALVAAQKSTARRRRTTLLIVMTQFLHVYQKLQFQVGGLTEREYSKMEAGLSERWKKAMEVIKMIAKPQDLPAAASLRVKAAAAPAKAATGVGSPTPAAKAKDSHQQNINQGLSQQSQTQRCQGTFSSKKQICLTLGVRR